MAAIEVDWHGNPALERILADCAQDGAKAGAQTVRVAADAGTPRREGELLAEGDVSSDGPTAAVSYKMASGGVPAAYLHEDTRVHFTRGHAKWLELAMQQRRDATLESIAERFRARIGS